MKWEITTPPDIDDDPESSGRVVEANEVTEHLRIIDDGLSYRELHRVIDAATDFAQESMSCSLLEQTITATFYAGEPIHLPRGPVLEVVSVTDANSTNITNFDVIRVGNSDRLQVNQSYKSPLTVVYRAGYGSASDVPAIIRQMILCHIGTLWEHRESVADKALKAIPHQLEAAYRLRRRTVSLG